MSRTSEPDTYHFERRLTGLAIGPGIAIGPMFGTAEAPTKITRHRIAAADIEAECARLDEAVTTSRKQLGKLRTRLAVLPEDSQAEIAPLLDAYAPVARHPHAHHGRAALGRTGGVG